MGINGSTAPMDSDAESSRYNVGKLDDATRT
jgi:hypothetical protein